MTKYDIILGMDPGTAFFYAAYIDKDKNFVQAVSDQNKTFGVPSIIAYKKIGGDNIEYRFGTQVNPDMCSLGDPLKTRLRNGESVFYTTEKDGTVRTHNTKALLGSFIRYLKNEVIKVTEDANIKKIVMGYPNSKNKNSDEYKQVLEEKVLEQFPGVSVIVKTEADLAADLLLKLDYDNFKGKNVLIVDVGAGTTDIAVASWNDKDECFEIEDTKSVDFGGATIDDWLIADTDIPKLSPQKLIENKKWIYGEGGEKIYGRKSKEYYRDYINEQLNKDVGGGSKRDLLYEAIEATISDRMIKQIAGTMLEIVLIGGSSRLPFIQEYIEDVLRHKKIEKYEFLHVENIGAGKEYGVTDSNFIAFAAAWIGGRFGKKDDGEEGVQAVFPDFKGDELPDTEQSQDDNRQPKHGAEDVYLIHCTDGTYRIIADPRPKSGKKYWITGEAFSKIIRGKKGRAYEPPRIYVLDRGNNNNPLPENNIIDKIENYSDKGQSGLREMRAAEIECYRPNEDDEKNEQEESRYIGIVYDYSFTAIDEKKLQVYLYTKKTHKCYKSDRQEEITYEGFLRRAKKSKNRK